MALTDWSIPRGGFIADECHYKHRRGRDDEPLGYALEHGKAHHLVPYLLELEPYKPARVLSTETASEKHYGGCYRNDKNARGDDSVCKVDVSSEEVSFPGGTDENANHIRDEHPCECIEETLKSVVIISVRVAGRLECEKVPVCPEKAVREPHYQSCEYNPPEAEAAQRHHHRHGDAAQNHAECIQVSDLYPSQQKSVHKKSYRNACIYRKLVAYHIGQVGTVPDDVCPHEQFNHRQHERIKHVRDKQCLHVARITAEMPYLGEYSVSGVIAHLVRGIVCGSTIRKNTSETVQMSIVLFLKGVQRVLFLRSVPSTGCPVRLWSHLEAFGKLAVEI